MSFVDRIKLTGFSCVVERNAIMCIYSQLLVSKYIAIARSVQTDKKCRKSVRYPFNPAAQMLLNSLTSSTKI